VTAFAVVVVVVVVVVAVVVVVVVAMVGVGAVSSPLLGGVVSSPSRSSVGVIISPSSLELSSCPKVAQSILGATTDFE
jgi:Kef-type K+ transport system membrane component KefB